MNDAKLTKKQSPNRLLNPNTVKIPPHSVDAEQSVLGGVMLDNRAWDQVADRLRDEDFYRNEHRVLFRAMARLAHQSKPIDVLTVSESLRELHELDQVGGEVYLFELANNTPSAANIAAYADIVRERSVLRQLIAAAGDIATNAFNAQGRSVVELLDEAERSVFSISEQGSRGSGPICIKEYLAKTMDRIDTLFHSSNPITGMATGYTDFDSMTSGLQPSDLVIVAGRPSMGKTTLAMNIAENVAIKNRAPVLIFSMEMPGESIVMRLLSSLCRIDQLKIRTGKLADEDWPRISSTVSMLSDAPFYIDDSPGLSPAEMRARARRLAKEHGQLGLIVVDYLQLMQVPGSSENRTAEISEISRSLKSLAKELKVPVLALSQLNRGLEQRADKRPVMSDLRECVTGDTLVCLSSGERVPIQDLVGQQPYVLCMDEQGKIVSAPSDAVWLVGKKPVYEVHLASGRSMKATAEHRMYAADGWKVISDLQVGDRLAIARKLLAPEDTIEWNDARVILLGQMIGDGSYLKHQPLRYTNQTKENIEAVIYAAETEFGNTTRVYSRDNWQQVVISGNGNRWHPKGVNKWLRELGIYNQRSHEKRIPQDAFKLNNRQVALLLTHLWATDGSIFTRKAGTKGSHVIYYATNSPGLAKDVASLLLRLDMVARIQKVQQGDYLPCYHVKITGLANQRHFLDVVGGFGPRAPQAEILKQALQEVDANTNIDTLPIEIFSQVKLAMQAQGISQRNMASQRGTSYGGASHFRFAPSRDVIKSYADILNDKTLQQECDKDIFWDRIVAITPCGEQDVYDLTVPGLANWLADGIVTHNSGAIEQDADLIVFIYRDEVYNENSPEKGTAEIIIAKQRNGPIGKLRLTFMGQYTCFENFTRQPNY
jgi:replicative DNA helicase